MFLTLVPLALVLTAWLAAADPGGPSRCERGAALALAGQFDRADSLLQSALGDDAQLACAYNQLGNVALLRGDSELAAAWYAEAAAADSADAGIWLNRALAHRLGGDDAAARAFADRASRLAGSPAAAAALVGADAQDDGMTGSEMSARVRVVRPGTRHVSSLSGADVRELLAGRRVPATVAASDSTAAPARGPSTRASGGRGQLAAIPLYWKR